MSSPRQGQDRLDYRTLCEAVYIKVRDEILDGRLKPGQSLRQTELATRFGISRMPVRDAIRKLEADGFATIHPAAGAIVAFPNIEEFQQVCQVREVLENLAARIAVPNLTDGDIESLRQTVAQMQQASRNRDLTLWTQMDQRFHISVYQRSFNPTLLRLITALWNSTHIFRRFYYALPGQLSHAEDIHIAMMASLADRDGELFARLTTQEIMDVLNTILAAEPVDISQMLETSGGEDARR